MITTAGDYSWLQIGRISALLWATKDNKNNSKKNFTYFWNWSHLESRVFPYLPLKIMKEDKSRDICEE